MTDIIQEHLEQLDASAETSRQYGFYSRADLFEESASTIRALLDRLEAAERGVDFLDMRRPIKGIECRSNEEVFAIMADRIRLAEAGHYRLPAIREVKP